jgi:hypothetical protein
VVTTNQTGVLQPLRHAAWQLLFKTFVTKLLVYEARRARRLDKLTRAAWASQFAKSLCDALPSSQAQTGDCTRSMRQLQFIWKQAAFPVRRSLIGGVRDPKKLAANLKESIVLANSDDSGTASSSVNIFNTGYTMTPGATCADPFAEIDDTAYERAVVAHKSAGLPAKDAPLNPEQRSVDK